MTQSFDIVPAGRDNIKDISEIERSCFTRPWSEQQLADELSYDYARLLAAVTGGKTVGFIDFHIVCESAHINNVAVLPEYRNAGIGSRLVEAAIDISRRLGCEALTLEVRAGNTPAKALYIKKGFAVAGVRRGFYSDPPEDGETMLLCLR